MKKLFIVLLLFAVPVWAGDADFSDLSFIPTEPLEIGRIESTKQSWDVLIDGNYVDLHEHIAEFEKRRGLDEKVIRALELAISYMRGLKWDYEHMSTKDFDWCMNNDKTPLDFIKQILEEYKKLVE